MTNEIKEILFLLHNDRLTESGKRKLEDYITNLQQIEKEHQNCTRKHWQQKCAEHHIQEKLLQERLDKIIAHLGNCDWNNKDFEKIYDIAIGSDEK